MNLLQAHKMRCAISRDDARRQAALNLIPHIGVEFDLSGSTNKAREVYADTWGREERRTGWDWPEIFRRYDEHDRLDLAMWVGNRLCGLALGTLSNQALTIRFLEGGPDPSCPLVGRRALIALEAAQCYAQIQGRSELRVEPIHEKLETLYRDIFGFALETVKGRRAYYRREIPR